MLFLTYFLGGLVGLPLVALAVMLDLELDLEKKVDLGGWEGQITGLCLICLSAMVFILPILLARWIVKKYSPD